MKGKIIRNELVKQLSPWCRNYPFFYIYIKNEIVLTILFDNKNGNRRKLNQVLNFWIFLKDQQITNIDIQRERKNVYINDLDPIPKQSFWNFYCIFLCDDKWITFQKKQETTGTVIQKSSIKFWEKNRNSRE